MIQVDTSKYDDSYFKAAEKKQRKTRGEDDFFTQEEKKRELPADYIANQKAVDAAVLAAVDEDVKGYLSHRFTLRSGDRPHLMKF